MSEKYLRCKTCNNIHSRYKCDQCEEVSDYSVVTIEFNYGSIFDGRIMHFCSDECFHKWADKDCVILEE